VVGEVEEMGPKIELVFWFFLLGVAGVACFLLKNI
jgi:hypothetical protein